MTDDEPAEPVVPVNWGKTFVAAPTDTLDPLEDRFDDFLNSPNNNCRSLISEI